MKTVFFISLLAFFMSFTLLGPLSNILTDRKWNRMYEYTAPLGSNNYQKFSFSCDEDNEWIFYPNGTFKCSAGQILCDVEDSSYLEMKGTWFLEENLAVPKVSLIIGEDTTAWSIILANDTMLLIEKRYPNNSFTNRVRLNR